MRSVSWDSSLETGDPAVDFQHHELLEMFDSLNEAIDQGKGAEVVGDILDRLSEYLMIHLETERRLMLRTGLNASELGRHLAEHNELTARSRELILRHRTPEADSVGPVAEHLRVWFCVHIMERDRALVAHLHSIDRR